MEINMDRRGSRQTKQLDGENILGNYGKNAGNFF